MTRTTIMLPLDLKAKAKQIAKAHGISLGELIRRALQEFMHARKGERRDLLFYNHVAVADRSPRNLAAQSKRYARDLKHRKHPSSARASKRRPALVGGG